TSLAERAATDGRKLWIRHFRSCSERARGGAVALLRLPRRGERTERRGDVARTDFYFSGYLFPTGLEGGNPDGGTSAGNHRRLRYQASHSSLSSHSRICRHL